MELSLLHLHLRQLSLTRNCNSSGFQLESTIDRKIRLYKLQMVRAYRISGHSTKDTLMETFEEGAVRRDRKWVFKANPNLHGEIER
jgi:hypothetical protein